jgi:hypothetical protein
MLTCLVLSWEPNAMRVGEEGSEHAGKPDESGKASTLDIVEEMIGCQLDIAEAERLGGAPDDQLGYFLGLHPTDSGRPGLAAGAGLCTP